MDLSTMKAVRLRRINQTVAGCGGAVSGVLLFVTPAVAAGFITVSPPAVAAGSTVVFAGRLPLIGDAFCRGGRAVLTSAGALFPPSGSGPSALSTVNGSFSASYLVPSLTPARDYRIGVRCAGGDADLRATVRVLARAEPVPFGGPQTGPGESADRHRWWVALGVLLGGAGTFLALAQLTTKHRRRVGR